ncbi:hypothetical protein AB0E83_09400 [Streptomyces sp. NPDC035033]|uniref:hypothetical protein n=1 Tax=Streptomyces sp. NPDC035033 TaxID=3155368 RepID=UPI0033C77795
MGEHNMSAKFLSALVAVVLAASAAIVSVSGEERPAPVRADASVTHEDTMRPTDTGWQ